MITQLLQGIGTVLVDPEHLCDLRAAGLAFCGGARRRRACLCALLRVRGDGVALLRCLLRRDASGWQLESSLSAEAICARLEALELTRSSCDLNSQSETPAGLSRQSLDAQISNYSRGGGLR